MTFWERIQILCKEKQTTPTALCKSLGLSTSMVTRWKNGTIPNNATLMVIAEALDVEVNYLMWGSGEKEKAHPQGVKLDESDSEFLSEVAKQLKEMTEDEKRELQNYVEFLKSRRKNG